jgi:hypothetical protein
LGKFEEGIAGLDDPGIGSGRTRTTGPRDADSLANMEVVGIKAGIGPEDGVDSGTITAGEYV